MPSSACSWPCSCPPCRPPAKPRAINTPNAGIDSIVDAIACQNYLPYMPCQPTANGHITARSRHPSGVMASQCDGSVRFVANNVALTVWQNVSTMNDGIVMSLE